MQLVRNVQYLVRPCRLNRQSPALGHDKRDGKHMRWLSDEPSLPLQPEQPTAQALSKDDSKDEKNRHDEEAGGMSRRLAQIMEETIVQGGRSAQKSIQEAGFSEELKSRLEAKILDSKFMGDHAAALSQLNMPVCPVLSSLARTDNGPVQCRSGHSRYSSRSTLGRYRAYRRCGITNVDRRS